MTENEFQSWKPDPGDEIVGKLLEVERSRENEYGTYPILHLDTGAGGEVSVHAFHQVLRSGIARKRPKIGDELTIKYLGTAKGSGAGARSYHNYRVSGGQASEWNWDAELPPEDRPQNGAGDVDVPIDDVELEPAPPTAEEIAAARAQRAEERFGTDVPF